MKKRFTERKRNKLTSAFSPDGIVTFETCPVCLMSGVKVEYGKEVHVDIDTGIVMTGTVVKETKKMKLWHCPECGDSLVIVVE